MQGYAHANGLALLPIGAGLRVPNDPLGACQRHGPEPALRHEVPLALPDPFLSPTATRLLRGLKSAVASAALEDLGHPNGGSLHVIEHAKVPDPQAERIAAPGRAFQPPNIRTGARLQRIVHEPAESLTHLPATVSREGL